MDMIWEDCPMCGEGKRDYFEGEIEEEQLYGEGDEGIITDPFDPKDVDIVSQPMVIANLVEDLKEGGDIILDPDFQRFPDLWDDKKQSRLIESLIIRIPLPTFYFDAGNNEKLTVVDGLQRLNAIRRFMALKEGDPYQLVLTNLEYLTEYNGYSFEKLPVNIQKRIKSQVVSAYIIRAGTPDNVRISIFTRINTGGMTLEPAEIRNSVYRGQAANLLKELAHSEEFLRATRGKIAQKRMLDCEFVNRFLAFYLLGLEQYVGNLEDFLNNVMVRLKEETEDTLAMCRKDFLKAMKYASGIFGETAFRKINNGGNYGRINKPLYDSVSVNLAKLSVQDCEKLLEKKDILEKKYTALLNDKDFVDIITNGTAKVLNVKARHHKIHKIFHEVLADD